MLEDAPKEIGMIYAIVAVLFLGYLFYKGKLNTRIGYLLLAVSATLGFLIFAPMLPNQMQVLLLGKTKQLAVPAGVAALILVVFVIITFILGRIFCGYVCPIGAVQELAYRIKTKKLKIRNNAVPIGFHLLFLPVFIILAVVFSEGLLIRLGLKDFFHLEISGYFYVFLSLVIIAVFIYRPFCRLLCPYGAILSLVSGKSRFRLRRTDECLDCGECEAVCPTNEAGETDRKQECYLCNRCKEICPADAIEYTGRQR
ncbi:MAG: 4Fe-4S binding protein [Chloroflexi bacterium]|nr:4Fe-4S binding protein [Chloroflexota bacterium]